MPVYQYTMWKTTVSLLADLACLLGSKVFKKANLLLEAWKTWSGIEKICCFYNTLLQLNLFHSPGAPFKKKFVYIPHPGIFCSGPRSFWTWNVPYDSISYSFFFNQVFTSQSILSGIDISLDAPWFSTGFWPQAILQLTLGAVPLIPHLAQQLESFCNWKSSTLTLITLSWGWGFRQYSHSCIFLSQEDWYIEWTRALLSCSLLSPRAVLETISLLLRKSGG